MIDKLTGDVTTTCGISPVTFYNRFTNGNI